jgi:hypothetical protein
LPNCCRHHCCCLLCTRDEHTQTPLPAKHYHPTTCIGSLQACLQLSQSAFCKHLLAVVRMQCTASSPAITNVTAAAVTKHAALPTQVPIHVMC